MGQNAAGDFWVIHQNGILEKLDGQSLKVVERIITMMKNITALWCMA